MSLLSRKSNLQRNIDDVESASLSLMDATQALARVKRNNVDNNVYLKVVDAQNAIASAILALNAVAITFTAQRSGGTLTVDEWD